MQEREGIEH